MERFIAEERYEPASVVHDQMLEALATGKAHQDWAALAAIAARHAGLPREK